MRSNMTADPRVRRFFSTVALAVVAVLVGPLLTGCGRAAREGDVVTVHFTGRTSDGKEFESTRKGAPRQLTLGAELVLPAFERAFIGMRAGEKKRFTLAPEQAYGPRVEDETTIQVAYKSNQAHAIDYRVGATLVANIQYPDGRKAQREVTIVAVDDKTFTVDGNHPLAGKTLDFELELVSID